MNVKTAKYLSIGLTSILAFSCQNASKIKPANDIHRPNILIAISDDQSFAHTSFAGSSFVKTPAFDRVASNGIYFKNCIAASPGCAPSRASLVTGRYPWQNEQSGQHAAGYMKKYVPFVDLLKESGYFTGCTGKGVQPFRYARSKQDTFLRFGDAAGKKYDSLVYKKGTTDDIRTANGISNTDYYGNFRDFLSKRDPNKPFFFWYGSHEPHRVYEKDSWKRNGKTLSQAKVPAFLPNSEVIEGDLLDYAVEIEWFNRHLSLMINYLDSIGELDNTLIIVTGDNGMPFPSAKANGYEYGIHVPLAISYPREFPEGRVVDDPVSFVDIAPTILELTGVSPDGMMPITGKSILPILKSDRSGTVDPTRKYVFSGRERHSSSRWKNLGYPQRAIRSKDYLLIWNQKPERYPAGAPRSYSDETKTKLNPYLGIDENGKYHEGMAYTDIDGSPTKSYMILNRERSGIKPLFDHAVSRRPEFEFFHIAEDPECLHNLTGDPQYRDVENEMKKALLDELTQTRDPRVTGPEKGIFDTYPRYSPMRYFPKPDWAEK